MLDLVEVAGRDVQRLGEGGLAQATLGAELSQPGADEGLGHARQRTSALLTVQRLGLASARREVFTDETNNRPNMTFQAQALTSR